MDKRVCVICAHKDYEQYLPTAVKSFENQTYPCHLCVIDDGSKKTIDEIIPYIFNKEEVEFVGSLGENTVVSGPKKTLIYMSENFGPSKARNVGIEYFWNYDAFMILDADDEMHSTKVEEFINKMNEDWDNIGVVYGDYVIFDEETGLEKLEYKSPFDAIRLKTECIVHSQSLINKLALDKCGLYREDLRTCEDFNLWLRISKHFDICHIPKFLTRVINHPNNSTYSVPQQTWNENFREAINV